MANVNIVIDDKKLSVPAGTTILQAAQANGIRIPTLCFMEQLTPRASCRMCVVEVEGARTFQHACATKVKDGMEVHTNTDAVRASRKMTLELILSNHAVDCHHCLRIGSSKCDDLDPKFCEMCFFCDCVKDGFCDLQALAREYKVDVLRFPQKHNVYPLDATTAIVRNPNKCVKCKRCVDICGKVQTVHNLAASGRGSGVIIAPAFKKSMVESRCVGCGRCVQVCPTGAIFAAEHKDELIYYAHRDEIVTVAMVSDKLIPELERVMKLTPGSVSMKELSGSLRKFGVKYVVNASEAEEAVRSEAQTALEQAEGSEPIILTNSYAAKKFLAANFPQLEDRFLFYPSAQAWFGAQANKLFAAEGKVVKTLAFGAIGNDAAESENTGCTDISVNPRELSRIMIRTGSEPNSKRLGKFDDMEHKAASERFHKLLADADWNMSDIAETFTEDGKRCVLCHNLGQARKAIENIAEYDMIRIIG